ncbi:MAG: hypothetical protein M3305_07005, partial [Actinomycetota bacterium]|nr:hypothetical protein [Actinomycetota bacterium]
MGKARTSDPNEAVGASLEHSYDWVAVPEEHTFDGTYGFTLWKPDPTSPQHPESGSPAMRVALAPDLRPEQIEATVQDQLNAYPYLPMSRGEVSVGEGRLKGVTVGPKPGSAPSTEVYVPVAGERVYRINVYGEQLDEEDEELLSSLEFGPPSQRVDSLELLDANAPEELYAEGDPE